MTGWETVTAITKRCETERATTLFFNRVCTSGPAAASWSAGEYKRVQLSWGAQGGA